MTRTIPFLCPHNAAKSVIAAAYCSQMAAGQGLKVQVRSAGTEPDEQVSPATVTILRPVGPHVGGPKNRTLE